MARTAAAQITPESIPCSLSVEPKIVRGEGVTELIGDVRMSFPKRPDLDEIEADVHIFLNTNITNRTESSNQAKEAILIIERTPDDTQDYDFVTGRMIGPSALLFPSVKLPLTGTGGLRTLRLLGVRANALQLTPTGATSKVVLFAKIESKTLPSISILNPQVTVGFSYPSFITSSTRASFRRADGVNAEFAGGKTRQLEINLNCTIAENFPDAFKNRVQESIVGAYMGPIPSSVTAERGTLFQITFANVPSGIRIYATVCDRTNDLRVRLMCPPHDKGDPDAHSSIGPMRQLPNTGGVVSGIWEWISEAPLSPLVVDTVKIGFALVAAPDTASVGNAQLGIGLGPVSTVQTCSNTAPVPRFGSVSIPTLTFSCSPYFLVRYPLGDLLESSRTTAHSKTLGYKLEI